MPLAQQPKNINDDQLKENEVKILRPRYNVSTGEFLGIENCVERFTVCNDPPEHFFFTMDIIKIKPRFCFRLKN